MQSNEKIKITVCLKVKPIFCSKCQFILTTADPFLGILAFLVGFFFVSFVMSTNLHRIWQRRVEMYKFWSKQWKYESKMKKHILRVMVAYNNLSASKKKMPLNKSNHFAFALIIIFTQIRPKNLKNWGQTLLWNHAVIKQEVRGIHFFFFF